ncbi:hypothetical protein [Lapillicoccus jejuensis]|uniref:hypothetical protein n=1 Tax=Lapillicoccus jejuensis TaxID=402171 RepID=UPI001151280E|nr:hypothetical protein [Lapillicoccus jejuensis]
MPEGRQVLLVRRDWPWGLTVMGDPSSREQVPSLLDDRGVAAARSIVVARIQHEVDGEATAEVWVGRCPDELTCVYEGEFVTASGVVTLADAAHDDAKQLDATVGRYALRVLVEEVEFPERVVFELTPESDAIVVDED